MRDVRAGPVSPFSMGHPGVFGLPAGGAARQVRAAEDARVGLAEGLLGQPAPGLLFSQIQYVSAAGRRDPRWPSRAFV